MPAGSKSPPKRRPLEVAAETKRTYLPHIKGQYPQTYSYLIPHPLADCVFRPEDRPINLNHPSFYVKSGDPVDVALGWQQESGLFIPVICAANDKRPGGDWETGVQGYEEHLCRRSSLFATLSTPAPDGGHSSNFPIPPAGGIYSPCVVVFLKANYDKLPFEEWRNLPVVSVPATRWPKLVPDGSKYSFSDERAMVKDKIRGALLMCAWNGHQRVVVSGDWGLGNAHRNPPRELAEVWREVLLYDPELRGRIMEVAFVFEDAGQSTARMIAAAEMSKKDKKTPRAPKAGAKGKGKGKGRAAAAASAAAAAAADATTDDGAGPSREGGQGMPADADIFAEVFDEDEIRRVTEQPDARYGLDNLLTK